MPLCRVAFRLFRSVSKIDHLKSNYYIFLSHVRVQLHRHASPQDPRPHLNHRRTSELGSPTTHDDTAALMCFEVECPLYACKPAKLEVRIIMDHVLHETYVK